MDDVVIKSDVTAAARHHALPSTSLWLHPAVVILVVASLSHALKSLGSEMILSLVHPVHSALFQRGLVRKQSTLKSELFETRQQLNKTSSQDEFAKWAKLRRKVDKTLADLEAVNKSLGSSRSMLSMGVKALLFVLSTGAPFVVTTYYRKTPIFWLPPGAAASPSTAAAAQPGSSSAANWLGPLGWFLSLPSAPTGAVSATVWNMVCGRILGMVSALLKDLVLVLVTLVAPVDESTLKPMTSASPALRSLWYGAGLASCSFAFSQFAQLEELAGVDLSSQYGGHYQFLTNICLALTFATMLASLMHVSSPSLRPVRVIKRLLATFTLPAELMVSLLYWTILAVNPSLLIPQKRVADPLNPGQFIMETVRLPLVVDLSMHAFPAIFLVVDFLFFSPPLPLSLRRLTTSWPTYSATTAVFLYWAWEETCASKNGHYPYPLLGLMTTMQRAIFHGACVFVIVAVLLAINAVHGVLDSKVLGRRWTWGGDAAGGVRQEGEKVKVEAAPQLQEKQSSTASTTTSALPADASEKLRQRPATGAAQQQHDEL